MWPIPLFSQLFSQARSCGLYSSPQRKRGKKDPGTGWSLDSDKFSTLRGVPAFPNIVAAGIQSFKRMKRWLKFG